MHCDYLNVTVPESHSSDVESDLLGIITSAGAACVYDGLYKLTSGGTYKAESKRGFSFFSASGDFLATLRANGLFSTYLAAFAGVPHNVSMMHVAHDVPGDSSKEIKRLWRKVRSDTGIKLTRKRLRPETQVKKLTSPGIDGRETGTIYLGTRKSEVWAKAYDKQLERLQRANQHIAPVTRFELAVSGKAGASLRDAYDPDAIFWHFMSDVLPAPPDAPPWEKGGVGFSLPEKIALLPAEALRRLVQTSPQLQQMFDLSDRIGAHGYEYLLRQIHSRHEEYLRSIQPDLDCGSGRLRSSNGAEGA